MTDIDPAYRAEIVEVLDMMFPEEIAPPLIEPTFASRIAMAEENWDIEAVVLIIDRRTCTCGTTYDTPSPRVMIRKRRLRHHLQSIHLERLETEMGLPYDVPREVQYVHSKVEACGDCFKLYSPLGQFELFPRAKPAPGRPRKSDDANGIRPLGIEDFL